MKINTGSLVKASLVAGLYYALTVIFAMVSYGPIQFRVAEILNLLAFYNPAFAPGIVVGVFLSNMNSPLGIYDLVFGTLHTALSLYFMTLTRSKVLASLWPTIFSFIIGFELYLLSGGGAKGFFSMTFSVMLSEFVICTVMSLALYSALEKNSNFQKIVSKNVKKTKKG